MLIRVEYSSLNYKDALSAAGRPGVTKSYPHVPGIDAAGQVVASSSPKFQVGQEVIVTGNELGANRWGATRNSSACRPIGRCRCRSA